MCGRFSLDATLEDICCWYGLPAASDPGTFHLGPRYNIAPSQNIAIVRAGSAGVRELVAARWGLIPSSAKEASGAYRTINARAETVATKATFRRPFRERRCVVPASGYYEWQSNEDGKTPYYIHRSDGRILSFAGLWDSWKASDGSVIESCTILTTAANDLVRPIHDRMPVILDDQQVDAWLDPASAPERLAGLLTGLGTGLEAYAISTLVNRPANDVRECLAPLSREMSYE